MHATRVLNGLPLQATQLSARLLRGPEIAKQELIRMSGAENSTIGVCSARRGEQSKDQGVR
jgi:hypothetical protein